MWKSNQNILPQKKTLTKCFVLLPCWFSIWCFVSIFISKEVLTVWFLFWSRMKAKLPNITLSFEAEITIPYLVPAGGAGWSQHTPALAPRAVGNVSSPCRDHPGDCPIPSHLWRGAHSLFTTITFYCTWWRGEKDSLTVERVSRFISFS